jgi:hypothetical protein
MSDIIAKTPYHRALIEVVLERNIGFFLLFSFTLFTAWYFKVFLGERGVSGYQKLNKKTIKIKM